MDSLTRLARLVQRKTGARYTTCLRTVRVLSGPLMMTAVATYGARLDELLDHVPGEPQLCVFCLATHDKDSACG